MKHVGMTSHLPLLLALLGAVLQAGCQLAPAQTQIEQSFSVRPTLSKIGGDFDGEHIMAQVYIGGIGASGITLVPEVPMSLGFEIKWSILFDAAPETTRGISIKIAHASYDGEFSGGYSVDVSHRVFEIDIDIRRQLSNRTSLVFGIPITGYSSIALGNGEVAAVSGGGVPTAFRDTDISGMYGITGLLTGGSILALSTNLDMKVNEKLDVSVGLSLANVNYEPILGTTWDGSGNEQGDLVGLSFSIACGVKMRF